MLAGTSVQWWMLQLRKPPRLDVPNLMKLQFEERRQFRTSMFSGTKSGLSLFGQIASSSVSTTQSSMSTFFESMSKPSLLKFAWLEMVTFRATTPSHSLK